MEKINLKSWYKPKIDKFAYQNLCKKSDYEGFKHVFIYFSLLLFFGLLAYLFIDSWWCILFFLIYGNIYCNADSIWHETGHQTAFKSKFWNSFFHQIASYMNNFEPVRWKWSHFKHHKHTLFTDPYDFEIAITKPTDLIFFFSQFIPFMNLIQFGKLIQVETLKHAFGIKTKVIKECLPKYEVKKCINSARIHVGIWVLLLIFSLYSNSILPLIYFFFPFAYGNTLKALFGLTQHSGLQENSRDHRLSTRTVILNPIFSFLYWKMEYHTEHHIFPNIPSYNLPKLHELIKNQLPIPKYGLFDAYKEIIPAIIKQSKDPKFKIK